jgi:hypothetical protein
VVSQTHDPGAGGSWSSQMRGPGRARRSGCSAHAMACDESVCHLAPLVLASPLQSKVASMAGTQSKRAQPLPSCGHIQILDIKWVLL